ncbi:MAG TPA: sterol desaturase family protein [Rudaea sp.]|nr:sterol desaturase family protein [Rudaea sp.]
MNERGRTDTDAASRRSLFAAIAAPVARLSTTRANGRAGLVADSGVSLCMLGAGLWRDDLRVAFALATIAGGLLLFSLVEYCVHRFVFHGAPGLMEAGHRKHHEDPQGYDALPFFLPPLGMLGLALLLTEFMPTSVALLLAGSLAAGYAAYGLGHTAIHFVRFRLSPLKRWSAAHHIHHYHPDRNFGVTTPLWDILLGTRYVSKGAQNAQQ